LSDSLGLQACAGETVNEEESKMTLCPIALVAGCKKCPAFSVCPLKGVIGDYKPDETRAKQDAENAPGGAKRDG
jgi:hypothetical protein